MSYILFEGRSLLDDNPIVVIMTGVGKNTKPSSNEKTGSMAQTYILRSDVPPIEAIKSGADASICGQCPHRPNLGGSCYVNVGQGPRSVWEAYKRGNYSYKYPWLAGEGLTIRIGAYGDPGAVPPHIWYWLLEHAKGWTGYTHQALIAPKLKGICMASADTEYEAAGFQNVGWKTFRVKNKEDPLMEGEILCLNETHGIHCKECGVCDGKKINVAINVHGVTHKINKYRQWSLQTL